MFYSKASGEKFSNYLYEELGTPQKTLYIYYCNLNHSVSFLNEQKSNLKIMDFKR